MRTRQARARVPTERDIGHRLPATEQINAAIAIVRSAVPRATDDDYPDDIAAPTALYLGLALSRFWGHAMPIPLAVACKIPVPSALEFAELIDIAAAASWVDWKVVYGMRDALSAPVAPAPAQPHPSTQPTIIGFDMATGPDTSVEFVVAGDTIETPAPARPDAPAPVAAPPRRAQAQSVHSVLAARTPPSAKLPVVRLPKREVVKCDAPSTGITFMELTYHSCRWPLGDPRSPEFRYCGHTVVADGKPYCAEHMARATTKVFAP